MSKAIAEQSNALSIFWLKKHHCLIPKQFGGGRNSGTITWTHGWSENKSSISYSVSTNMRDTTGDEDHIKLNYTHTNHWTGEKSEMDFKIPLTTTPCNYGGVRYWFICPLSKNGQYCGRRVGVIYSIGKLFGCRYCGEIAYYAQFEGGKFRAGSVCEPDVEQAYHEAKIKFYNGKPTRKYRRYLRLSKKMDIAWIKLGIRCGVKFWMWYNYYVDPPRSKPKEFFIRCRP